MEFTSDTTPRSALVQGGMQLVLRGNAPPYRFYAPFMPSVLGDVSFGDIRNISFLGEGQGLGPPGIFDSPASSEHSSRSSRSSRCSSRHSNDVAEMA